MDDAERLQFEEMARLISFLLEQVDKLQAKNIALSNRISSLEPNLYLSGTTYEGNLRQNRKTKKPRKHRPTALLRRGEF